MTPLFKFWAFLVCWIVDISRKSSKSVAKCLLPWVSLLLNRLINVSGTEIFFLNDQMINKLLYKYCNVLFDHFNLSCYPLLPFLLRRCKETDEIHHCDRWNALILCNHDNLIYVHVNIDVFLLYGTLISCTCRIADKKKEPLINCHSASLCRKLSLSAGSD